MGSHHAAGWLTLAERQCPAVAAAVAVCGDSRPCVCPVLPTMSSSSSPSPSPAATHSLSASDTTLIDVSTTSGLGASEYQEVDSLPSSPTSSSSSLTLSDIHSETEAEREWKESLQQIELLLSLVIVPYLGKFFGRKFAFWGWKRFMEWKYPVEVVVTDPLTFNASGALAAAASL